MGLSSIQSNVFLNTCKLELYANIFSVGKISGPTISTVKIFKKGVCEMGYIEESLVPGEEILYKAKISLAAFITPIILLAILWWIASQIHALLVVIVALFSIIVLIQILVIYLTTEFGLTNKRIIAKKGLIRRHSLEILLSKVESVSVTRSIDGMIFGFGTVTVVGSGGTNERFGSISNPMELRKRINAKIATL